MFASFMSFLHLCFRVQKPKPSLYACSLGNTGTRGVIGLLEHADDLLKPPDIFLDGMHGLGDRKEFAGHIHGFIFADGIPPQQPPHPGNPLRPKRW